MKSSYIIFISIFLFCKASTLRAQAVDTSDANVKAVILANIKCDSADAHIKRKDPKGANKLYADAIKQYKLVIKANPNLFSAWYGLGRAQTKTKDYKEAVLDRKSTRLNSSHRL